ncbi:hypothetical protein LTR66_003488 [Elasticomyces elasticus]|nr:hypothetical protein LTR66_003488 [Elasticomyces elasticus]
MSTSDRKIPTITISTRPRILSEASYASSLKTPRIARFAEATAVNSPIEPPKAASLPFADPPTNHYLPQPQPSDIGFGYLQNIKHDSVEMDETDTRYLPPPTPRTPLKSPLKSAMKSPGVAPRNFGEIMSPTFKEEQVLEKHEEDTEKVQAQDLKVKTRVRMAKMLLRGVNFSCSLIVLSMLATTFAIFNATKAIPPRNNLPPWASGTKTWPQTTLLVIACVSLLLSMIVFYAYVRGGHKRAEKVAVYYSVFAVAFFVFSIVMWGVGAGILNSSKQNGNGQDLWGWSCKNNKRASLFENVVHYNLVCRLQNWSLVCCIIEVVVETITIVIYGVVFYRFYSKRQLRKSMAVRDRARSDLYLAHLRSQSAPNTPGLGPLSPRDGGWRPPVDYYANSTTIEAGHGDSDSIQYVDATKQSAAPRPFQLQPPPIRIQSATPKMQQVGFTPMQQSSPVSNTPPLPPQLHVQLHHSPEQQQQRQKQSEMQVQEHFAAAPGEQVYEAVPIPGAYASPLGSPTVAPKQMTFPVQHSQ